MNVLITGANGHIGCHTVREALHAGWTPIGFVRSGCDRRGLEGLDVELREGDLLDSGALDRAMEGVELVLHIGAAHRNFATDPALIVDPAVKGTRNVIAAAKKRGVRRLVHTSTGATVGFAKDPARPLDEEHHLAVAKSAYVRGKIEAEKIALGATDGLEVVVLNPSGVFGPRDYKPTPATRALIGILQGDPAFMHIAVTDVRDVARAQVLAADKGTSGERYLVCGDNLAPAELAALFAELGGVRPPTFRPPAWLIKLLVGRQEKAAAKSGGDAPASRDAIDDLAGGHLAYDAGKSRRELGVEYRPARDVLRDSFRWLLHLDVLKPKVARKVAAALGSAAAPDPGWV